MCIDAKSISFLTYYKPRLTKIENGVEDQLIRIEAMVDVGIEIGETLMAVLPMPGEPLKSYLLQNDVITFRCNDGIWREQDRRPAGSWHSYISRLTWAFDVAESTESAKKIKQQYRESMPPKLFELYFGKEVLGYDI